MQMFSRSPVDSLCIACRRVCIKSLTGGNALIKSRRCLGILNAAQMLEPDRKLIITWAKSRNSS